MANRPGRKSHISNLVHICQVGLEMPVVAWIEASTRQPTMQGTNACDSVDWRENCLVNVKESWIGDYQLLELGVCERSV